MKQSINKLKLEIADYFHYNRPLSLLWEKQGNDSLSFSSRVRGVEIAVIFEIIGERVKGILTVGKSEQNGFLKNQISFALNKKSHKADFNRLGFHLVATAIGHIKVNQELSD
jgi:hypothetical protein